MENEFDFDRIGKRLPYKTPAGFMDEMEANVWNEVQHKLSVSPRHRPLRLHLFAGAVAASVALLLLLHTSVLKESADSFSEVEQAFASLSMDDQSYMLETYQEDIFMNH